VKLIWPAVRLWMKAWVICRTALNTDIQAAL
jgi:hypothetical protein